MTVFIIRPGRPSLRSRNLRGIRDYGRRHGVDTALLDLVRSTGQAYLSLKFDDGAHATAEFADWRLMRAWVRARRGWRITNLIDLLPS